MTKTKNTPIILDRLAAALGRQGVTLKRTALLQVAASAFGYSNTHEFTAADKAGEIDPPTADLLDREETEYGDLVFLGDPDGGVFAVQADRIGHDRASRWIVSPTGGLLAIPQIGESSTPHGTRAAENFANVPDQRLRGILERGETDEDSICSALFRTREAFDAAWNAGLPASAEALGHLEEAEYAWNEEGDGSTALESLRSFWRMSTGTPAPQASGPESLEIDPEAPIYLTNGCCESVHESGWMFAGTDMESGSFAGEFYPLTDDESRFIAEDLVASADGRMHALTGYSALYRGRKHLMPSIELPAGREQDAPPLEEVRAEAREYASHILPKVAAIGGNVLIDSGIDDCVVVQILVPIEEASKFGTMEKWHEHLAWLMVDPELPGVIGRDPIRHEGRKYAVSVEWIGEGDDGDYDPMHPYDAPLLRYDAQRRGESGAWEDLDDGSYCTQVAAYAPDAIVEALPRYLASCLDQHGGSQPKRLLERLSWTTEETVRDFLKNEGRLGVEETPRDEDRPVMAEVHSDDWHAKADFDIRPVLRIIDAEWLTALQACSWGGDKASDDVALHMEGSDAEVAFVLDYARTAGCGFECTMDADVAMSWIRRNRPDLARAAGSTSETGHGDKILAVVDGSMSMSGWPIEAVRQDVLANAERISEVVVETQHCGNRVVLWRGTPAEMEGLNMQKLVDGPDDIVGSLRAHAGEGAAILYTDGCTAGRDDLIAEVSRRPDIELVLLRPKNLPTDELAPLARRIIEG